MQCLTVIQPDTQVLNKIEHALLSHLGAGRGGEGE